MRSLPIPIQGSCLGLLCAAALGMTGAFPLHSFAAEPAATARFRIDEPPQALAETLRSIARQTGSSVLFDPAVVSGRKSRAVSGQWSAAEAMSQALQGSGLVVEVLPSGSIVVKPATLPQLPAQGASASQTSLRLASADGMGQAVASLGSAAPSDDGAQQAERVQITGSRLARVESEGPAPVNVYTHEEIERSGQPTLERFLSTLNEASVSPGEGSFGDTAGQGAVQLRGLPLGSTLVLVNGRRIQAVGSSAGNFFNLNLIPLAAVERVEVVPVGSSAVYGGDALAGVVNIILKKSIDGFALDAKLAGGKGTGDSSFSLAAGGKTDKTSFALIGSYSKTTPLNAGERGFFSDADFRRYGSLDRRSRYCTPGTVRSLDGSNLPGLDASFAGIPSAAPGTPLSVASFVATSGQANLCNDLAGGRGLALVYGSETLGLHGSVDHAINADWSAFAELTYANDKLSTQEVGIYLADVVVPAENAFNPFGTDVSVRGMLGPENGAQAFARQTRFTRALVGVRGDLGHGWDMEAAASTSRDRGGRQIANGTVDFAALDASLASSDPATALNPFATGRAASDEVLRGIWSASERISSGQRDQASAFVRGPVFKLPAGTLDVIVGAEFARDRYETAYPGDDFGVDSSRRSSALYTELRAPLLKSDAASGKSWTVAALTVAGRRDRYSDFGAANTYQAGLELRPSRTLLLRASAASSFKPPTLVQTGTDELTFPALYLGLTDPARGNEPVSSGEAVRASNPDLGPERGKARSLGAVWEPESLAGTRFGLTAWQVKITDLIALMSPQVVLDNEALFPGLVTRGPSVDGRPGPIQSILYAEVNYGGVDTAGIDMELSRSWKSAAGAWSIGASATRTTEYKVALTPDSDAQNRLGRRFDDYWAPKWKGRLAVSFDRGPWNLGLTSRYIGSYKDAGTSERSLGGIWFHDLAAGLNMKLLGMNLGHQIKTANVSLAITNLTDRQPQFVETSPYYDVTQGDWRGRYASLRLAVGW